LRRGVVQVDFDGRKVEYAFGELDELTLAYATTIYKSQGSEYPAVIIPLVTQHFRLLERNLLGERWRKRIPLLPRLLCALQ
jgi:exodeoxyribonuclease V alpha subunit